MSEKQTNPLLENLRLPGETFTLPSLGMFYDDDVFDKSQAKNGEIHVYPMTSLDEIIIRTPDKLYSGKAIEEVFQRCIPSIRKPLKLFTKDVDFLLVCLRKVSYGDTFDLKYKHTCENAKEHSYEVDIGNFLRQAVRIDPTTVGDRYHVVMPNKQQINLRPATYEDIVVLLQDMSSAPNDEEITEQQLVDRQTKSILSVISDVDGIQDREFIHQWIAKLPPGWIKKIVKGIERTTDWGPLYQTKIKCKDCGEKLEVYVPMNPVSFFI